MALERCRYSRIVQLIALSAPRWFVWANGEVTGQRYTFTFDPVEALALVDEWSRESWSGPETPTEDDAVERVVRPIWRTGIDFEIMDRQHEFFADLIDIIDKLPETIDERLALDAMSRLRLQHRPEPKS